jgi:hypothetical protein
MLIIKNKNMKEYNTIEEIHIRIKKLDKRIIKLQLEKDSLLIRRNKLCDCSTKESKSYYSIQLPFFKLIDKSDEYNYLVKHYRICRSFQDAKDIILKIVISEYFEEFRHKEGKEEKVWYNK